MIINMIQHCKVKNYICKIVFKNYKAKNYSKSV